MRREEEEELGGFVTVDTDTPCVRIALLLLLLLLLLLREVTALTIRTNADDLLRSPWKNYPWNVWNEHVLISLIWPS
jgi:hypothetical protein